MPLSITKKSVGSGDGSLVLIKYEGLTEADTSPPSISVGEFSDMSVQVSGTFNGGTVLIEGSNDESIYSTLTDPQGNSLSFTSSKLEQITEIALAVRPRVTAGTGVAVDVSFLCKRASSLRT